jgi:signal transduction histidine kinase
MTDLLLNELRVEDPRYESKKARILDGNSRKTAQYVGEGLTFLVLILIGAVFVYRATRRQLRLSSQQQNFMMAVTHELKTPIAVIRLNVETLQKRKFEEAQQQKLIGITLQEVNRLNSLCNNILLASQLDAGQYRSTKNEVNLSEVATRVINDFKTRHQQRTITSAVENDIVVMGEELLLELLMSNLVENAIKYSSKDEEVIVQLAKDKKIVFKVIDAGPGIPEEEKEKIFDKFYRIGNETTRSSKGTGLGLYLCRQIAIQHSATVQVAANQPKGSVFTVTFNG